MADDRSRSEGRPIERERQDFYRRSETCPLPPGMVENIRPFASEDVDDPTGLEPGAGRRQSVGVDLLLPHVFVFSELRDYLEPFLCLDGGGSSNFVSCQPRLHRPRLHRPLLHRPRLHRLLLHRLLLHRPRLQRPRLHRPRLHRLRLHRPRLHRPRLHRPRLHRSDVDAWLSSVEKSMTVEAEC